MPLAFWCVLLAGIMPVLTVAVAKSGTALDNRHPRDWAQGLEGYRRRAYAAHQNAFEAFPFFAAAVLTAHLFKGANAWIDLLAVSFVLSRIAYTACYVADWHICRSLSWFMGWMCCILLFVLAGVKISF